MYAVKKFPAYSFPGDSADDFAEIVKQGTQDPHQEKGVRTIGVGSFKYRENFTVTVIPLLHVLLPKVALMPSVVLEVSPFSGFN